MISPADLLAYLPVNPVILEAGAHWGEDTAVLAQHAAHVYAFEPVPSCYERASNATAGLSNVTLSSLALGGEQGMAEMYVSAGVNDASSSLMRPNEHILKYPHIAFSGKIHVKVTTIEAWAEHHNVDHIDGMWLDMQGSELSALKAAGTILQTVTAIMLEISTVELYQDCPLWPTVRSWLAEQGFHVVIEDLYSDHAGDALVVRS